MNAERVIENSKLLGKTFLFAEEIAHSMLDLKVLPAIVILIFILFAGKIGMETAYGQSSAPFANCISLFMAGDAVQLNERGFI